MEDISKTKSKELEQDYVKSTYDNIANDFSSTRYKKWPKVDAFLKDLPPASFLLDVGCGNGKYLDNSTSHNIGCDVSLNLLKICKSRGHEVVLCDMSALPFRAEIFDAVICIAALHHVVSSNRRKKCLNDISELMTTQTGKLLVQVWALEQELDKSNPYLKRTPQEIPDVTAEDHVEINDGLKLPVHKNRTPFKHQDVLVPFHIKSGPTAGASSDQLNAPRQLRYYHVFKEHELESEVEQYLSILESYYDKGNWCVVGLKAQDSAPAKTGRIS